MLVVDEVDNGRPGITIVDVVAKSGCVDDGELDLELLLLEFGLDNLNLCKLVKLLVMAPVVVFGGREFGGEEGVDKSGFPKTRLAWTTYKSEYGAYYNIIKLSTNLQP